MCECVCIYVYVYVCIHSLNGVNSGFLFQLLEKFRERVLNENTLPTELEKRCRDERVHKIINTKIQNLKRKRLSF